MQKVTYTTGINILPHDTIVVTHFIDNDSKPSSRQLRQKTKFLGGIPKLQNTPRIRGNLESKQEE